MPFANNLRFPGQYYDAETGQHYNYFRDYDPTTGRYIQSDPIGILRDYSNPLLQAAIQAGIPLQPLHLKPPRLNHLYGYVDQNPLNDIDPFGLERTGATCEQKLRSCRLLCGRGNMIGRTSACLTKCEEKYGALSDCKDGDPKNECNAL